VGYLPFVITTLGKVRQLLREASRAEDKSIVVTGPFRRGRGDYTAVIDFRWSTQGEGAGDWYKLGNALSRRRGGIMPLAPVERQHFTQERSTDTVLAVLLDADNEREAIVSLRTLASDIEGMGFPVDTVGTSTNSVGPYS
jgi:hypothetical protein